MTYTEQMRKFYKALDFIDLKPYLIKDKTIEDIFNKLDGDCKLYKLPSELYQYMRLPENNNLFQDDELFNFFNEDELLQYIRETYPQYHWHTEYYERTWLTNGFNE